MTGENPNLSFPCTIEDIREYYDSVGLIQELDNHVIISTEGKDIYLIKRIGERYLPITIEGQDISESIEGIDTFRTQVTLKGGVVTYDDVRGNICKYGEYLIGYDLVDNQDAECKIYTYKNGVLESAGIVLYTGRELLPFTFCGQNISSEIEGITAIPNRADMARYKGIDLGFDEETAELINWEGYAIAYDPNDSDTKKFYQLYNVSGDTAVRAGFILIKKTTTAPESIVEQASAITLNGVSISSEIEEVKNEPYNGLEIKYKDTWLQVDEKTAVIKTYQGLAYGINNEVDSVNAPQHFYKLYSFDAETPFVCGYGVGMNDNEFIPITLNGKDISRDISNMFESSHHREDTDNMTIHGRIHIEIEGMVFSLSPMTGKVITLKGHPINLVENGVNIYSEGENGYELRDGDNRLEFNITLNDTRVSKVLEFERSSYKYDTNTIELDGIRVSVDNDTMELCNIVDGSGKQFLYYLLNDKPTYYFINNGRLAYIQDTSKVEELEGLRKGTPDTVVSKSSASAMKLVKPDLL